MTWTTPEELREQVEKLWTSGKILKAITEEESLFPQRLALKIPASNELGTRYGEVLAWLKAIRRTSHYRLVERRTNFRNVGWSELPAEAWIDTEDAAASWLGKKQEIKTFRAIVEETRRRRPCLLPWIAKKPLFVLTLTKEWNRLLDIIDWCLEHPHSNLYLRQVGISGIDTKFIETHKGTLYDWLNLALPPNAIVTSAAGTKYFNQRFGFRDKPLCVRFRVLNPLCSPLPDLPVEELDITVTGHAFSRISPLPQCIFITENEINFLAFPQHPSAWVIFGSGYGFEALKDAEWLKVREIHYWGDIDTHGFAALDQFRATFPNTRSLLMDEATLLNHRANWVEEPSQAMRSLSRLTADEQCLFDGLCHDRWGNRIRLEQERISMQWLLQSLEAL